VSPDRVHVVYYGTEPGVFHPAGPAERAAARRRLGWPADRPTARPVVAFIGALGHDRNKGFDVLFRAWQWLSADPWWDADLVVAGGGAEVDLWRHRAEQAGLAQSGRVRVLGFTKQVPDALAAADALVSPTHYDAYGLCVHEALCCGLPAFVTRSAGVAERYPAELGDLLLGDPPDAEDLVTRLRRWRADIAGFRGRVAAFARELRRRTWADMSRDIMSLFQASPCGPAAGRTYCGLSRAANSRL
jgi:glycosyltransferase involved in cell wall biosynthesis